MKDYLSLIKFSHTIFALPFAIIGYLTAIAQGNSWSWKLFLLVIACMVFARSAAMGFNRYIDRKIDAANPRTANREIPSGKISPSASLVFVVAMCILFIMTTYFINDICFYLSPVALIVILGYSLTKRFTALCHLILGLGLSLAPIGAYLAVTGEFNTVPILFSLAVLTWVGGFDVIYALQDADFDAENKLHSIPSWVGKKSALIISVILHVSTVFFLVLAGILLHAGYLYWIGFSIFSALLAYQHTLVKPTDLSKVNKAFFTSNGIASVVFAVFVVLEILPFL